MTIQEGVGLSDYTTFRLGGGARYFAVVHDLDELREAVKWSRDKGLAFFVLGGGSNTLFRDKGFDGLVIKMELRGVSCKEMADDRVEVIAAAGEIWDTLVAQTVERGIYGLENLSAIPGTVGAAPIQNIGAYGREVKDMIAWVEVYDTHQEARRTLTTSECRFGYRNSVFKTDAGKKYIVTHVAFVLKKDGDVHIQYKDLKKYFEDREVPALRDVRNAVIAIRSKKFPDLSRVGTAGSFFKNPIIADAHYAVLQAQYGDVPAYPAGEGMKKIPIAWFLDRLGWKDVRRGTVGTWSAQPLVLVQYGHGSSDALLALADEIIEDVRTRTGIMLEKEVCVI